MYMYMFVSVVSYPLQARVQEVLNDMGRNSVDFFTELMEAFHHVRHCQLAVLCIAHEHAYINVFLNSDAHLYFFLYTCSSDPGH